TLAAPSSSNALMVTGYLAPAGPDAGMAFAAPFIVGAVLNSWVSPAAGVLGFLGIIYDQPAQTFEALNNKLKSLGASENEAFNLAVTFSNAIHLEIQTGKEQVLDLKTLNQLAPQFTSSKQFVQFLNAISTGSNAK
ncbi:MAG: hypothetical protein ACK5V3_12170, partial [Bdellovibrionales bacterium]